MVRLTIANLVQIKIRKTCYKRRGPFHNHRVPLEYKHFQKRINPAEIVQRYSEIEDEAIVDNKTFMQTLPNMTADDIKRNQIFQDEMDRQRSYFARLEKIKIVVDSEPGKNKILMMNKNLSTPLDCARHINELLVSRTAVAELLPLEEQTEDSESQTEKVNNRSIYWDMHRPLTGSHRIRFRHFVEDDVEEVNKAYWRSCSFLLGVAIRRAFKDGVKVMLHSWPRPDIRSGSFVYDVAMNLDKIWKPSDQELRAFSKLLWDICEGCHKFERLTTSPETAMLMFQDNNFKLQQIQDISAKNEQKHGSKKIDLYRCAGYIDISVGPMISHTGLVGRISLASIHQLDHHIGVGEPDATGMFYRYQGVSIPSELRLNSFVYQNILLNKAKKLNHIHEKMNMAH